MRIPKPLHWAAVALAIAGCAKSDDPQSFGQISQAFEDHYSVSLGFPSGHSHQDVAIYATSSLKIAERVKLKDVSDSPAMAINVGHGRLTLGAGANTGALISGGPMTLNGGVRVTGDAQAGGEITKQADVKVSGREIANTPLGALSVLRYSADFPTPGPGFSLSRNQSASLDAGHGYGPVAVYTDATLNVSAGTYYLDSLHVEPHAVLNLDTQGGAVVLHVRGNLNFKGDIRINGPTGRFLLDYLGTEKTSIESPFNGTILAPNATLRLAPVDTGKTHRGSFFAKEIDAVEAGSTITYEPFSGWFEVMSVRPLLQCVRSYRSPRGAALFGYENLSDFAITIPAGAANTLTPPSATPPTELQPGRHPREFWAPFDTTQSATWLLAGESAVATSASTPCQPDDVTEQELVERPSTVRIIEPPDRPGPTTMDRQTPDVTSNAFTALPGPVFGGTLAQAIPPSDPPSGDIGTVRQALKGVSETGPFTFRITSMDYRGDEGLCFGVDPIVKNLTINGESVGDTGEGTVQVPRTQKTVHVHVEVWDDDDFLCFGDELLSIFDFDIDNLTGEQGCTQQGEGTSCWVATGTANPPICFDWNAQFIDAGPWAGGVSKEDYEVTKGVQAVPASFARVAAKIERKGSNVYEYSGTLDKDGCLAPDKTPDRELWKPGANTVAQFSLISQFCLDPKGTDCAQEDGKYQGVNVVVEPSGQTGPASLCTVFAEDPSSVSDPNCVVRPFTWTEIPPAPVRPAFLDQNGATRIAAVVSRILAREDDTNGGLGVRLALGRPRLRKEIALYHIRADEFCCIGGSDEDVSCSSPDVVKRTSCQSGDTIFIEPDSEIPSMTRFKYVVAHEFGHFIQDNGYAMPVGNYGLGAGMPGQDPLCRCDSVRPDENMHCLQSLELPNPAQTEGFGQFFASKVWNRDVENDCTFVYYKNFEDTSCLPGVEDCAAADTAGHYVNKPPIPVNCRIAKRWRNEHCIDANSSPDVLRYGTEYDWMEFFYAINNLPEAADRWSVTDILDAYVTACGNNNPNHKKTCDGRLVSWAGNDTGEASLQDGATALAGGEVTPKGRRFRQLGRDYGVSDQL